MVVPFNTTSTKNTTIFETNYCHLSVHVKQVESLKIISKKFILQKVSRIYGKLPGYMVSFLDIW